MVSRPRVWGRHQRGEWPERVPRSQGGEQRAEHRFHGSPGREVRYSASERKLWDGA